MPRLAPKNVSDLAEYADIFQQLEAFFGFQPNDIATLGHKPAVMKAAVDLTGAILLAPGKAPLALKLLVMYVAARRSQSMYCTAHLATLADRHGVTIDKIEHIHEYKNHPSFLDDERAAIAVAEAANQSPNAVTDADFGELRKYFDDEAIAEIVSAIGLMAFFNKWNDTVASPLEQVPRDVAARSVPEWSIGKHMAD
jgi:alkylhydroperoxidase family enzyme